MTSTFTPNIQLEEPARGDDVGTWDTPVNANMVLIDLVTAGIATQALTNANIVLSANQFKSRQVTFTGTLSGSVTITFPTSFTKAYQIYNNTTSASVVNTVTLQTTASGGQVICAPPGDIITVVNDGSNLKYIGLERIGTLVDFCAGSVPPWILGCTVPPYLTCDGTLFSSATYPALATQIGSPSTPDLRGRTRVMLNQGTNRVTTAVSGINGDALFSGGGNQLMQSHLHTGTTGSENATHTHTFVQTNSAATTTGGGGFPAVATNTQASVQTGNQSANHQHAFTTDLTGTGASQNMPPSCIIGVTMIRAA